MDGAAFLGQKVMQFPWWAPDLVRELRFLFTAPSTCPWGAIGLVFVAACFWCCILGFILGALTFSAWIRRLVIQVLSLILGVLQPVHPSASSPDVRGRLAQYRRGQSQNVH